MTKSSAFKYSLKRFRRDLEQVVNEKALLLGEGVCGLTASAFQQRARARLLRDNNAKAESKHLITEVANNITVVESKDRKLYKTHQGAYYENKKEGNPAFYSGNTVKLKIDKEGLALFLEYGTGLKGEAKHHPETESKTFHINWKYAVNDGKEKLIHRRRHRDILVKWYPTIDGVKGFVFKKKKNRYIDKDDIRFNNLLDNANGVSFIRVPPKEMVSKNGKPYLRRGYTYFRRRSKDVEYSKTDYILSQGITPIKYIYETKKEIRRILQSSKDVGKIIEELNKLKSEGL